MPPRFRCCLPLIPALGVCLACAENSGPDAGATEELPPDRVAVVVDKSGCSCAITAAGRGRCWSDLDYGACGKPNCGSTAPWDYDGLPARVLHITGGYDFSCALLEDEAVYCRGYNYFGELGSPDAGMWSEEPVRVQGLGKALFIASGTQHTCAIVEDGDVWCWGRNSIGQLGPGTTGDKSYEPVRIEGLTSPIKKISAWLETLALSEDGNVYCWGGNYCGDGMVENHVAPIEVEGIEGTSTSISAGDDALCAATEDGGLFCWGENTFGAVGDGTQDERLSPVPVQGIVSPVRLVSCGSYHSCVLTVDSRVFCWGVNNSGQLGIGLVGAPVPTPTEVVGLYEHVQALSAGIAGACVSGESGSVWCWGGSGLGNGIHPSFDCPEEDSCYAPTPVRVLGFGPVDLGGGE